MKYKALVELRVGGKNYAKGDVLEVGSEAMAVLLEHGWVEEVKQTRKRKAKEVTADDGSGIR